MKFTNRSLGFLAAVIFAACIVLSFVAVGCKAPHLEPGGAYAPTNAAGQVVYNDLSLAVADATYKGAYQTVDDIMKFEVENRAAIFAISPTTGLYVKHHLDQLRPTIVAIDRRWALARQAYANNPTPAGMSAIQTVISQIQRLIPAVQAQMTQIRSTISTPPK